MENNQIQIDRYLQGLMAADEKAGFEQQLANDPALVEELETQQLLIEVAKRSGVKQAFAKAIRAKIMQRRMVRVGVVVLIAITALIIYAIKTGLFSHGAEKNRPALSIIPAGAETIQFNNDKDTIIETKEGVVFAIPAGAFKHKGTVELKVKSAITPYDIMRSGLSTVSNGSLLKTAGMFYINGFVNGEPVALVKNIEVSVPASHIDTAIHLFDGVPDANGKMNWTNPKPIERGLLTCDIRTLDFYPKEYIPVLKALGKNYLDKHYTDSLYYSFAGWPFSPQSDTISAKGRDQKTGEPGGYEKIPPDTGMPMKLDTIDRRYYRDHAGIKPYEIDPARIAAIWNEEFNNTLLATKEFEERLRYMHSICYGDEYLNIYLQNLDKPLYYSDEKCAQWVYEGGSDVKIKFDEFAARHDGSVRTGNKMQQKLSAYFQLKYKAYQEAAEKSWQKFESEYRQLDKRLNDLTTEQLAAAEKRIEQNFQQELCINLTDAYRQIGIARTCNDTVPSRPPSRQSYNVTISTTGWKNLDAYVFDATVTRQSVNYTDPQTGKTASITYQDIKVQVQDRASFDKVLAYLLPDSLDSFQEMNEEGGFFEESLNSLLQYDLLVIGYKGEQVFYAQQKSVKAGDHSVQLQTTNENSLRALTNRYSSSKPEGLQEEIRRQQLQSQAILQIKDLKQLLEFHKVIELAIYPCVEGGIGYSPTPATPREK